MRPVLVLLRKSLLIFRRARAAVAITFLVPVVLIYIFGHVFGLYRKDSGPAGIPVGVVNAGPTPAAQELITALQTEPGLQVIAEVAAADGTKRPLTEADARAALQENHYRFALILPDDMISGSRFGLRFKFLTNPRNEIEAQMVYGLLQKALFTRVPQLLGQSLQANARNVLGADRADQFNQQIASAVSGSFGGNERRIKERIESGQFFGALPIAGAQDPSLRRLDATASPTGSEATAADAAATRPATPPAASAPAAPANDFFSRIVSIETEQVAGKDVKNPMAARIVGGYAIMFLLFAVSASSAAMFEEKKSGLFQRLLSSPVRPSHIVWSRFLFGLVLGLAQITALFIAGRIFFGLDIVDRALPLFCVALAAAAACSGFGMLIAALAPSQEAAQGLSTFLVISMSAIGGAWFPVSFMPGYIQAVSKLTLVYWSVEGFTDVLWAGKSLVQVLPAIGILAGMAAAVMAIAVWRFSRRRFFE